MTPEKRLMNEIRIWCGEHNLICIRANVGKVLLATGQWFDTGLPVGFPDLMIFNGKGETAFCETKIHPRKPSAEQLEFLSEMKKRRFRAIVAYSLAELVEQLEGFY